MRYRPIGPSGGIISAVSLSLTGDPARSRPGDWVELIYAALENGINGFEVAAPHAPLVEGLAEAFAGFDRKLAFVAWRLGGSGADCSAAALMDQVKAALAGTRLSYLDAVMLDDPPAGQPPRAALDALGQLKSAGLVRHVGVAGEGDAIDGHIESGGFDILQSPFNLACGWRERHRLRTAGAANMSVLGYRSYPSELRGAAQAKGKAGAHPLAGCGTYAFLEATPGWRAEEICLAYALTEPALASVLVRPGSVAELARTAAVADRDMPPGLAAQIEMARFSPQADGDGARTLRRA